MKPDQPRYVLFNDLNPEAKTAARSQFEDAKGFDGWLYQIDPQGRITDRVRGPFPPGDATPPKP